MGNKEIIKMTQIQNTRVSVGSKIKEPVCKRCGDCCQSGTLLKQCTEKEKEIFKILYIMAGEDISNKKCPFLDFKLGMAICKIYKDRPWFCREHFCDKCY